MNKLKNKSISNQDNSNVHKQVKSVNNYNCIGPCYPPYTIFYNPLTMASHKNEESVCPIKPKFSIINDKKQMIQFDKCATEDINTNYMEFDIFNDFFQLATNYDMFLSQIYKINNITDSVHFITNSLEMLPIYSQKRLLNAIFEVYYRYIEFPKKIFIEKLQNVLEQVYQIENIDEKKILSDLNLIQKSNTQLYQYFKNKYLKK